MITAAVLEALAAAGATTEMIIAAVQAAQNEDADRIEAKAVKTRALTKARKERWRARQNAGNAQERKERVPVVQNTKNAFQAFRETDFASDFGGPEPVQAQPIENKNKENPPHPLKKKEKQISKKSTARARTSLGSRLPLDWEPSREDIAFAKSQLDIKRVPHELDKFKDYWHSKSGAGATKIDWSKTFHNWCRTAAERGSGWGKPSSLGASAEPSWKDRRAEETDHAIRQLNRVAGYTYGREDGSGFGEQDSGEILEHHDIEPNGLDSRDGQGVDEIHQRGR